MAGMDALLRAMGGPKKPPDKRMDVVLLLELIASLLRSEQDPPDEHPGLPQDSTLDGVEIRTAPRFTPMSGT